MEEGSSSRIGYLCLYVRDNAKRRTQPMTVRVPLGRLLKGGIWGKR
jgi:hypothetical protein